MAHIFVQIFVTSQCGVTALPPSVSSWKEMLRIAQFPMVGDALEVSDLQMASFLNFSFLEIQSFFCKTYFVGNAEQ
jgi:hypothetical protein